MEQPKRTIDDKLKGILSDLLLPTNTIIAILLMCKSEKKKKKLYKFVMDNIRYVTESEILQMATMLNTGREQIMPHDLIVKYIGEDDGEVVKGNLYQVGVAYNGGEIYKIKTEKRHIREYPADLFVVQRPTEIKIVYIENPIDGEELEGLEVNKVYKVVGREKGLMVLDNGSKCYDFRGEGEEFEDVPPKKLKPLDKKELLRRYMLLSRFNNSKHIRNYIREDCEYVSEWSDTHITGRQAIIDRARMVFKNCVEQNVFYYMNTATVIKTNDEEALPLNTPCMGVWEEGKLQSLATIDVDEEGYIYRINYFSKPGITIAPDSTKENYIEIIDGHDGGGMFWFKPCNVDLTDNKGKIDYYDQVNGAEDEISIDEIVFDDYLAYFFLQEFDEELAPNKIRYDGEDRIEGFGWYLEHNFYTYEQIHKIIEKIWDLAINMESKKKEEFEKDYPVLETKYCKPLDLIKDIYENVNFNPCAAHDFYLRFTAKLQAMMDKNPDMKYFYVMGP